MGEGGERESKRATGAFTYKALSAFANRCPGTTTAGPASD